MSSRWRHTYVTTAIKSPKYSSTKSRRHPATQKKNKTKTKHSNVEVHVQGDLDRQWFLVHYNRPRSPSPFSKLSSAEQYSSDRAASTKTIQRKGAIALNASRAATVYKAAIGSCPAHCKTGQSRFSAPNTQLHVVFTYKSAEIGFDCHSISFTCINFHCHFCWFEPHSRFLVIRNSNDSVDHTRQVQAGHQRGMDNSVRLAAVLANSTVKSQSYFAFLYRNSGEFIECVEK